MKKIERIREDYDIITEKDDSDTRKLTSLVRAGLFDQNKLPMLKRALQKDPSKLTMAERKGLLELLDSLMSQVLHSQSVYSKVKQNVGTDVNEAVKDHYGPDPRFGNSAAVSERDMPTIIILKRKSIRVYPDNQKVGLYYSQYLDRYVAIPFGMSKKTTPFTAINEGLDEAVDYNAAYRDYKDDNPDDETKDKILNKPNKLRKFVAKKAAQGKIRSIHYSSRPNWLGGDKEKNALKKVANKDFNKNADLMDYAAQHTGLAIGNAIRKGIRAVVGKKPPMEAPPPKVKKTKEVSAPVEEPKATKAPAPVVEPKVTSTAGKATASFGSSMSAPITARVSAPVQQTSKPIEAPKTPEVKKMPSESASNKKNMRPIQQALKKKWRGSMREDADIKESFRQKITERRRLEEEKRQYGAADAAADAASFIPGPAGSAASLASAGLSVSRGDYVGAALDTIGAVPLVGYAAKAAKVARVAKTASEVGKVGKAVDTASDVAKVADKATDVAKIAKPASVASKVGGTLAKGAGKTLKLGGKILKGAALIGAGLAAGAGSSSANDDKKDLTPAKFDMKVKTNTPSDTGTKSGVDTRTSNLYRKSFEGSMKEETAKDDEDKTKTSTPRRFLRPASAANSKVKISAPKQAGVTTGVDARMRKYERDFYGQQNESVMSQIKAMVKEDVTEMQLNIGENTLKINNTIAKKVVGVYESLNIDNKKKMEDMLNEGTTESFMKLINFAVRQ
jgi:hypothetical protein